MRLARTSESLAELKLLRQSSADPPWITARVEAMVHPHVLVLRQTGAQEVLQQ